MPLPSPLSHDSHDAISRVYEQVMSRFGGASLTEGNEIECLHDSTENFPAWLNALKQAQDSICIEMYIFADDVYGTRIRDLLIEKAQSGVSVVLVYDWFGSLKQHYMGFFKPLLKAGATVHAYNRLTLANGFNLLARNHRKVLLIDQAVAFISGLCISNQWEGNPMKGIEPWRDMGVRLKGPIVADVMAAFIDTLVAEQVALPDAIILNSPADYQQHGEAQARLIATTPSTAHMMRLDLMVISLAKKNLWLTDAYFMPTGIYMDALKRAALAGVDVRLLVPRTSDIKWIGTVSRTLYRPLLESGVRVFEWNGPMIHAKMAVVDSAWARVGSTNLNISSWLANREIDVAIEDPLSAQAFQQRFLEDLDNATEVVLGPSNKPEPATSRSPTAYSARASSKAGVRQAIHLGETIHSAIRGKREVSETESWAFLSLGLVLLLISLLIFMWPKILTYPLIFIGLAGAFALLSKGLSLKKHKIQQKQTAKTNSHPHKND
ncbi:MAG: phosphatidylserine/phosphatidylglycerophosphate/cardiolipin synthase family protein [Neisseriaceae bacterium]|nr:phosphatidylserine/phosphatidylglycerophosphate/cardiolipin synthase family protein [Neisseriaceae bacterium]MBP6860855.1 phosphatidylserine/phosphatidylglycerophosphate/cardiolipin synthase family protein [Neisseriaceae bacterium]